ncbi:MAG: hypothetical protein JXA68_03785 [Ignavibacteriales bacterium]|nr:hypothetical protein [Ignavibacteriales bacterium]
MYKKILLCIAFYLLLANITYSQKEELPFENIQVGANYFNNFNKNEFHKYWNSTNGAGAYLKTPFYFGFIKIGLNYSDCQSKSNEQPDFVNLIAYLDWGKEFQLPLDICVSTFFKIGISQMDFERSALFVHEGFLLERELLIGTGFIISYDLIDRLQIFTGLDYQKTFTQKPMELSFLQIGLSYKFDSPEWLKDFLK